MKVSDLLGGEDKSDPEKHCIVWNSVIFKPT